MSGASAQAIRQVIHRSLPELAYDTIREMILTGQLEFDQPLRQHYLAEKLGMSRLPIREALRRLDAEGFVILRPRRGYYVPPFDREEMEDALEVQMLLEERAAYLATLHRRPGDVERLEDQLQAIDAVARQPAPDPQVYARANGDFHETLFSFCRRDYLLRLLRTVTQSAERYARLGIGLAEDFAAAADDHQQIFEAFKAGDAKTVARLSRLHRERARRNLVAHVS